MVQIENPDFEDGFYQYNDIPELTVPVGWQPFWLQGTPEQTADGYYRRPEFKPEPIRVFRGRTGAKLFTTFSTHDAGMYQHVLVPRGALVTVRAHAQYWSEHTDGTSGGLAVRVGIDPEGGTDPWADRVVWGDWAGIDTGWNGQTWTQVTATAYAISALITVYLRSACRYRAKHNDSYWDAIEIECTGGQPPEPEPPAPGPGPDPDLIRILTSIDSTLVELTQLLEPISTLARRIGGRT